MNIIENDLRRGFRPGVGMLYIHDGRVLVARGESWLSSIERIDDEFVFSPRPDWKYAWDIPQGGIQIGEDARNAIRRETEEELGPDWQIGLTQLVRREERRFPVHKDGRTYEGKTYYYNAVEVVGCPDFFDDWVWGPHGDEGPYAYPVREFPGGVLFMTHEEAVSAISATQRGWKAQLLIRVIGDLKTQGFIH